jgi:RNA polymerase sigma factor (sigma-70 family)
MDADSKHKSVVIGPWSAPGAEVSEVRALVLSAAAGDQLAWSRLVSRYHGAVVATVRGMGLGQADVADVSQTTWLRLFQHIDTLHHPERVRGWLVTTARNEALRLLRQGKRETASDDLTEVAMESPEHGMDGALIAAEQKEVVDVALQALSPRCARLVRLLVADKSSTYAEVAAQLGMPVGSLGPTRTRCLALLRRQQTVESYLAS